MPALIKEFNKEDAIRLQDKDVLEAVEKGKEAVFEVKNAKEQKQNLLLDIEISIRTLERLGAFKK